MNRVDAAVSIPSPRVGYATFGPIRDRRVDEDAVDEEDADVVVLERLSDRANSAQNASQSIAECASE